MSRSSSLAALATIFDVPAEWFNNVISLESSWNPTIVSDMPYNMYRISQGYVEAPKYAKGLIQFTDETAVWLGYKDAQDIITQFPDIDSQMLGPVRQYFAKYAPYDTEQALYMAVFYPSYRYVSADTEIGASAQTSNPSIDTVQSYINKARAAGARFASALTDTNDTGYESFLLPIALVGMGLFLLLR